MIILSFKNKNKLKIFIMILAPSIEPIMNGMTKNLFLLLLLSKHASVLMYYAAEKKKTRLR
jgi:hypothetical protein